MNVHILGRSRFRSGIALLAALVVLAPVFAWAAGQVGYAEPLENAAEAAGATGAAVVTVAGVFPDYSVPGLGATVGTLVAAAVGTVLTLGFATALGRVLAE